jgi:hypothetical protein
MGLTWVNANTGHKDMHLHGIYFNMIEREPGLELKWKLFGCRHGGEVGQLQAGVISSPIFCLFYYPVGQVAQ